MPQESNLECTDYRNQPQMMQTWESNPDYPPNKVRDDEQLHDPVDDAYRPALHHHWLGGLVGEEVRDAAPQQGAHGCSSV